MRENINIKGLATYDFHGIKQKQYSRITKAVVRKFKLCFIGEPINEDHHIQQEFSLKHHTISIEWEFMIGYVIYSKTQESNILAKEIATFVNKKIEK